MQKYALICIFLHCMPISVLVGTQALFQDGQKMMTLEELVLEIIRSQVIQEQKALLNCISEQGHAIDQSTLSRLLKKLNIRKHLGKYVVIDSNIKQPSMETKIIIVPPNLIVLKTKPGFASAVSISVEENKISGIAGTIAGDDTVFVAVLENYSLSEIAHTIETMLD